MAEHNKKKVVILNHNADIIGYFDSLNDFVKTSGFPLSSVSHAFRLKRVYKCMLIIPETEYHQRYRDGTIEELKFKTLKERNKDRGLLIQKSMTRERILERNSKISESIKKRVKAGQHECIYKAVEACRIPIVCNENGKHYTSIREASRDLKVNDSAISKVLKGKRKRICGYTFRYENEDRRV